MIPSGEPRQQLVFRTCAARAEGRIGELAACDGTAEGGLDAQLEGMKPSLRLTGVDVVWLQLVAIRRPANHPDAEGQSRDRFTFTWVQPSPGSPSRFGFSLDVTIRRPAGDGLHAPLSGKAPHTPHAARHPDRSEEHTSE